MITSSNTFVCIFIHVCLCVQSSLVLLQIRAEEVICLGQVPEAAALVDTELGAFLTKKQVENFQFFFYLIVLLTLIYKCCVLSNDLYFIFASIINLV